MKARNRDSLSAIRASIAALSVTSRVLTTSAATAGTARWLATTLSTVLHEPST